MITISSLAFALGFCVVAQTDAPAKDLRAGLPRDVRIVLLGVPSVKNTRSSAENLARAVEQLEAGLASGVDPARIDQDKSRVFFRLGQLDDAMSVLRQSLRDQEHIKGLEEYRDFARA